MGCVSAMLSVKPTSGGFYLFKHLTDQRLAGSGVVSEVISVRPLPLSVNADTTVIASTKQPSIR